MDRDLGGGQGRAGPVRGDAYIMEMEEAVGFLAASMGLVIIIYFFIKTYNFLQ
jgi:hypothetical protein